MKYIGTSVLICARASSHREIQKEVFFPSEYPLAVISSLEIRAHVLNDCSWFYYKKRLNRMVIKIFVLNRQPRSVRLVQHVYYSRLSRVVEYIIVVA